MVNETSLSQKNKYHVFSITKKMHESRRETICKKEGDQSVRWGKKDNGNVGKKR
jgi:hypothetical protein